MKKYLAKIAKQVYQDEDEDFYGLPYYLEFENLPEIDGETVDFENFEWLEVSDDTLVVCCGGDWQDPLTLTIKLIDDKLSVINSTQEFNKGLSEDDFNLLIFGTNDYKKIENENK